REVGGEELSELLDLDTLRNRSLGELVVHLRGGLDIARGHHVRERGVELLDLLAEGRHVRAAAGEAVYALPEVVRQRLACARTELGQRVVERLDLVHPRQERQRRLV